MLGLHGRPCEIEVFKFQLAEILHMTVMQLEENMTIDEYEKWFAYLEIKSLIQNKTEGKGV